MVDFDNIRDRLMKGVFVGVGAFSASFVERLIEDNLNMGDFGTAAGQAAVGLGVSLGADEVFTSPQSLPNDFLEFAGYGMQGAAWSNIASSVRAGRTTSGNTVSVNRSTGQNIGVQRNQTFDEEEEASTRQFQADVG